MRNHSLTQIVLSLTGPVQPVGETHTDEKRLENLVELCALYDALTIELFEVANLKGRQESSYQTAAKRAQRTLDFIKEEFFSS